MPPPEPRRPVVPPSEPGWRVRARRQLASRARQRRAEVLVGASFVATMTAGFLLLVVYLLGGNTQIEGFLLFITLGGIGFGLVMWAAALIPAQEAVEPRPTLGGDPIPRREMYELLVAEAGITRRTWLKRLLLLALGSLGAALVIPVLSLGPPPARALFQTAWRPGLRLVNPDGEPVAADDLELGGIVTVFPEGLAEADYTNSSAVLLRIQPELLEVGPEAGPAAPSGFVCYSKLCTHAGCAVGLYLDERHLLVCPCHQSIFDALRGAVPVSGPAARPLPYLPIQLMPDGTFVAVGDFSAPVGPTFWNWTAE